MAVSRRGCQPGLCRTGDAAGALASPGMPPPLPAQRRKLRLPGASPHALRAAPTCRSPASLCAAIKGPLAGAGTAVVCGTKRPAGFVPAPKKGRYVVIELASSVKGALPQLAAAEVVVYGRGEQGTHGGEVRAEGRHSFRFEAPGMQAARRCAGALRGSHRPSAPPAPPACLCAATK